jgi:calcineurin-like phosphoesterase family protein
MKKKRIPQLYQLFNDRWFNYYYDNIFIISDTHFDEEDMNKYYNRPSSEEIVSRINSVAHKNDTLIILGDVGNIYWISKLKAGRKILITGNHDKGVSNYERKINQVSLRCDEYSKKEALDLMKAKFPNCTISIDKGYLFEKWDIISNNNLFDEVYEGPLIIGPKLILSHEPVDVPFALNIHGHTHNKEYKNDNFHYCVCAEKLDYKPINLKHLIQMGMLKNIKTIHEQCIEERNNKNED